MPRFTPLTVTTSGFALLSHDLAQHCSPCLSNHLARKSIVSIFQQLLLQQFFLTVVSELILIFLKFIYLKKASKIKAELQEQF